MANEKKVGRNDLCPCGSGKKYKDCCLPIEEEEERWELFRRKMDGLYPKINAVNAPLLIKSNEKDYKTATFTEAMDFTVTSNALSLIKSVHQKSELSATTALSARDVIEALVIIKMYEDGVITEEDEKLFLCQYALIEYDTYYQDGEKFASLLNLDDLKARYERAKKVFNDAGVPGGVEGGQEEGGKLRQAVHSRVPFMCKHVERGRRIDFNKLLSEHLPEMLPHYDLLSYYAHPNVNTRTKSRGGYYSAIKAVVEAVAERYANYGNGKGKAHAKQIPLSAMLNATCNPPDPMNSPAYKLQRLMLEQGNILVTLSKDFEAYHRLVFEELTENKFLRSEDNYLTRFFVGLPVMLYDLTYDYLLVLKECVKIKFKTIAETFAYFDRVISESINSRSPLYGVAMLKYYELLRAMQRDGKKLPDDIPPATADLIYETYKENYPKKLYPGNPFYKAKDKEKGKRKFLQSFCQPRGNFVDGGGQIVSFIDLVRGFYEKTFGDQTIINNAGKLPGKEQEEEKPVLASEYMSMLYRESNNMSHGCGYLFFTNIGAFGDVDPVMQEVDRLVLDSVKTVIGEIRLWQKNSGNEEHYVINEFLKNLDTAAESLAFIALEKSVLYRQNGV